MKSQALIFSLAAACAITGCQQTPASTTTGDNQVITAGVQPQASPAPRVQIETAAKSPATTWYTHEGAELLYRQGKYPAAISMCEQAIAAITKASGDKSPDLAAPLIDEATVYMRLAKFDDARKVMDRAELLLDPKKPEQALLIGRLGINKGWRLYTLGQTDAATKVFEDAEAIIEKNQKGESIDQAELINNLGLMYEEAAQKNEDDALMKKAERDLLKGWEMRQRLTGESSFETAESLNNLGMHFVFNGDSPAEIKLGMTTLQKSLDMAEKVYGESHPETAMSHAAVALALLVVPPGAPDSQDQDDAALRELNIALPMTEQYLGDEHPDRSFELMTLGRIYQDQNHLDEAEKAYLEALAIDQHVFGKTHPNVIPTLQALKGVYDQKGDSAKSLEMKKEIDELSGQAM